MTVNIPLLILLAVVVAASLVYHARMFRGAK